MKFKLILISTILFLLQISAFAQGDDTSEQTSWSYYTFTYNVEAFNIEKQRLRFGTWDETNDYFFFDDSLQNISIGHGFGFSIENINLEGLSASFEGTGSFRKDKSLWNVNLGIGKAFQIGNGLFVPKVMLGYGAGNITLGKMENWDEYVEIGDTFFYGDSVTITINSRVWSLTPQIDLYLPIGGEAKIRLSAGYKLGLPGKDRVKYDGFENEDNTGSITERRPLKDDRNFLQSNENVRVNPSVDIFEKADLINFSGLKFQIGFVIPMNR